MPARCATTKNSAPPTASFLPRGPSSAWNWPKAARCAPPTPPRPRCKKRRRWLRWTPCPSRRRWPKNWPAPRPTRACSHCLQRPARRPPRSIPPAASWRWKACRTPATSARCCAARRRSGLTLCCWGPGVRRRFRPKRCAPPWARRGGCRYCTRPTCPRLLPNCARGVTCLAAALYRSRPLDEAGCAFPGGLCVVIGSEGQGLSEQTVQACDAAVRIPMTDRVESLNAGVAGSVLLWHFRGV